MIRFGIFSYRQKYCWGDHFAIGKDQTGECFVFDSDYIVFWVDEGDFYIYDEDEFNKRYELLKFF